MMIMKEIQDKLIELKSLGVVGIKQSTEDEGALHQDIAMIRDITRSCGLKLSVKIGGCEANTDISFCDFINVDGIVAPMVESEFALQKFTESVSQVEDTNFYVNIESSTAAENIQKILESSAFKVLDGIVVGRSDLAKSYGYGKGMVDSPQMQKKVCEVLTACKSAGSITLMGGNINAKSTSFIERLYANNLLDFIETRNVIIKLDDNNTKNLLKVIREALIFESLWLEFKANKYLRCGTQYKSRAKEIKERL
tara:strand:- start:5972 stop:6730 length:759 start_codon:yes stop_codon:yes gene_type:complete